MKCAMLLVSLAVSAFAADVNGQWNVHLIRFGEEFAAARVSLKADGTQVTGTLNELKLAGTLEGDQLRVTLTRPNGDEWGKLEGRVQGDEIGGTVQQGKDQFTWKGRRAKENTGTPKTHEFEPTAFQRVFSGAIPPALHINPGDTIKTTTVDAGGTDGKGVRRSMGW
jgi:amidase